MKKSMKKYTEKDGKHVNILGININSSPLMTLLTNVEENIAHNRKFYIVTPNPELVLMATKDKTLKNALEATELSVIDGIGLIQAAKFLSLNAPKYKIARFFVSLFQGIEVGAATFLRRDWLTREIKQIKGRELFMELMKLADKKRWKVFFLGGEHNEAREAAKKISLKYKEVQIKAEGGPMFDNEGNPASEVNRKIYNDIVKRINTFGPQLLIVCLQDPKEEKFVYKNHMILNVGGAAAFGGTFRYIAGYSKLPPKWMGEMGVEWLWRLVTEPYRFKRIFNAFPVFPLNVFWFKVTH